MARCKAIIVERFWSKVEKHGFDECWPWIAGTTKGYGGFWDGSRAIGAHCFSWELVHGPVPDGLCVLHSCDNRPCVNPTHLWLGSRAENSADMVAKGRSSRRKGEANPRAKLTEEQVRVIRIFSQRVNRTLLASRFGVSNSLVGQILRRKCWKHI